MKGRLFRVLLGAGSLTAALACVDRLPAQDRRILDAVPELHQIYNDPAVRGALISLLGENYRMNSHRHCHMNKPGTRSQDWHQDSTNVRHHQVRTVLGMYYPQDVSETMGPTVVLPGTHFRNAPTDRMATYAHFREQVVFDVPAGTVAITIVISPPSSAITGVAPPL